MLEEKADVSDMELKSQREALDKRDATIWDGLQAQGTSLTRYALG